MYSQATSGVDQVAVDQELQSTRLMQHARDMMNVTVIVETIVSATTNFYEDFARS